MGRCGFILGERCFLEGSRYEFCFVGVFVFFYSFFNLRSYLFVLVWIRGCFLRLGYNLV